ncbi:MAG: hypothetical protein KKE17_13725 [Proteobacteria bacterium]|nr:hypothetical protein [Pseudomonadota bacterium]MBU1711057.1 hypothetical protein [Pseudomonadota bacterium]
MRGLLVLVVLVSAISLGFVKSGNQAPQKQFMPSINGAVTVNWDYDSVAVQDIKQLRLYYAGGSLICATDDVKAQTMNCGLEATDYPEMFKLTACLVDGTEKRYPATFKVN